MERRWDFLVGAGGRGRGRDFERSRWSLARAF